MRYAKAASYTLTQGLNTSLIEEVCLGTRSRCLQRDGAREKRAGLEKRNNVRRTLPKKLPSYAVAISVVASIFGPISVANAATRSPRVGAPQSVVTRVSVSLATETVKPGQRTEIVVTVRPRIAGRTVYLRRLRNGRFVNVASVSTNQRGTAIFHQVFRTAGTVKLRASVTASGNFPATTSSAVIEDVTAVVPFVLPANTQLQPGDSGPTVTLLQQRLSALGYWLGTPNGNFGDATEQAVYALEKAAGINRSGIVGTQFVAALNAGALPLTRTTSGNAIEVNLETDLVLFVKNGVVQYILNTSTGGGYTYTQDGATDVATTPKGVYSIGRVVDGLVVDSLGSLWRPRFFYEGFAIHGDGYVPPIPVSHGCVRVSNEAIDWIWASNLAPIGLKVWVY